MSTKTTLRPPILPPGVHPADARPRRGRPKLAVSHVQVRQWRAVGHTQEQCARLAGVSKATMARVWREMDAARLANAEAEAAEARATDERRRARPDPEDDDGTPLQELALRAIRRVLRSGGDDARTIAAAKEALAEHRREDVALGYGAVEGRRARALVREQARRLGVELRRVIRVTGDDVLRQLYYAAASTTATEDARKALTGWILAHPEVLRASDIVDGDPAVTPPTPEQCEAQHALELEVAP